MPPAAVLPAPLVCVRPKQVVCICALAPAAKEPFVAAVMEEKGLEKAFI